MSYFKKLNKPSRSCEVFHLVLIKPTRYDDDGYSIHWDSSPMPSNSLACVLALANDCRDREVLGPDVEICVTAIDELIGPVDCAALAKEIAKDGGKALIGLVGVQSNQYPRAMDLARAFRRSGLPVCIGGFHVTGVMSMFSEPSPEILEGINLGISFFLGEAENGRLVELLNDAYRGNMRHFYDYQDQLPSLEGEPIPLLPPQILKKSAIDMTCMDMGRGCPFDCSFCCIINVQGKKSRFRTADDLEKILMENHKNGVYRYFITDDNFARNKNWSLLFDRMIEVQQREGFKLNLMVQVDMMCHRVRGFIDKASDAGAEMVFFGLENINPENLKQMHKPQNKVAEYRNMMLQWKKRNVLLVGGYIIGLPNDTKESVLHDIDIIKNELPLDMMHFSILTPLPGSRDHKEQVQAGVWMDQDLNKYDLNSAVAKHPNMATNELDLLQREAFQRFYTDEHMHTVMKRTAALGGDRKLTLAKRFKFYGHIMLVHDQISLDCGLVRKKYRLSRRPGYGVENWWSFYPKYCYDAAWKYISIVREIKKAVRSAKKIWKEVQRVGYNDAAMIPQPDKNIINLSIKS